MSAWLLARWRGKQQCRDEHRGLWFPADGIMAWRYSIGRLRGAQSFDAISSLPPTRNRPMRYLHTEVSDIWKSLFRCAEEAHALSAVTIAEKQVKRKMTRLRQATWLEVKSIISMVMTASNQWIDTMREQHAHQRPQRFVGTHYRAADQLRQHDVWIY